MSSGKSDSYFKCPRCGRFIDYKNMDAHFDSQCKEGIATESPPAPATVASPMPQPRIEGQVIPPIVPEPKLPLYVRIPLMYKSFPKAFRIWTAIVFIISGMFWTSLFWQVIYYAVHH